MKNGQKVQGLKRWHTDIMPIAYAPFSFLKKENQAKECSKKEQ
jgi:hypothetical protein